MDKFKQFQICFLILFSFAIFECPKADVSNQLFIPATQSDLTDFQEKFRHKTNPIERNRLSRAQNNPNALRSEIVKLNYDYMLANAMTKDFMIPPTINLNVFGKEYLAKLKKIKSYGSENYTWIGEIKSQKKNIVVLTFNQKFMAGQIEYEGQIFLVKPLDENLHTIYQTDDSYGAEKHAELIKTLQTQIKNEPTKNVGTFPLVSPDASSYYIDLMVAYTDDALAGSASIVTEIQNDVAYGNLVLANSCANFRIQLVDSYAVNYDETANSITDLTRLSNTADGGTLAATSNLNEVTTRRVNAAVSADLVQLWVETSDVCGLAYAPSNTTSMISAYGFSLKLRTCSSTTFIHEIGHNLGLSHDRYVTDTGKYTVTNYGSGYGHVDTARGVTTIMSYPNKCSDAGVTCSRIAFFSNPRVNYNGSHLGRSDYTDAISKINSTWATAASYQVSTNTSYTPDLTGCQANSDKEDKLSPCFIATATFGSPFHPYVNELRGFKRKYLETNDYGRLFIKWYYKNSPPIANSIRSSLFLKKIFLILLAPIILMVTSPALFFFLMTTIITIFTLFTLRRKIKLLITSIVVFFALGASSYAQIASPSFDFTEVSINPAASSYKNVKGNVSVLYAQEETTHSTKNKEFEKSSGKNIAISASYLYGSFGVEGKIIPSGSSTHQETLDTSSNTYEETKKNHLLNLSYRLLPFSSIGLGYEKSVNEIRSHKNELSTIKIGGTFFISNFIFIGLTHSKNSETQPQTKVLDWSEQHIGVGASSLSFRFPFRLELGYSRSSEVVATGTSPEASGMHPETTKVSLNGELVFDLKSLNIGQLIVGASHTSEEIKDINGPLTGKDSPLKLTMIAIAENKKFSGGLSYGKKSLEVGNDEVKSTELTFKISLLF